MTVVDSRPRTAGPELRLPDRTELEAVFRLKFGDPERAGWGPRMRWRAGHFTPDEHYEALVRRLVGPKTRWLDAGCGRELFPNDPALARELAGRCARLVGVDPDATILENRYVHEAVQSGLESFRTEQRFDLVTLRMVAEHVEDPEAVARTFAECTAPGGLVVVFTVHRFAPVPLLTTLVPFRLRHPIKRFLWRTEAKDTFPTRFRMNTRTRLRRLFDAAGFDEALFATLDDCRTLARFRLGLWAELRAWRVGRALGVGYVERCLLAVYRRWG